MPTVDERTALLDGRFTGGFIEGNFSELTHNINIFKNDFICNQRSLSSQ